MEAAEHYEEELRPMGNPQEAADDLMNVVLKVIAEVTGESGYTRIEPVGALAGRDRARAWPRARRADLSHRPDDDHANATDRAGRAAIVCGRTLYPKRIGRGSLG